MCFQGLCMWQMMHGALFESIRSCTVEEFFSHRLCWLHAGVRGWKGLLSHSCKILHKLSRTSCLQTQVDVSPARASLVLCSASLASRVSSVCVYFSWLASLISPDVLWDILWWLALGFWPPLVSPGVRSAVWGLGGAFWARGLFWAWWPLVARDHSF